MLKGAASFWGQRDKHRKIYDDDDDDDDWDGAWTAYRYVLSRARVWTGRFSLDNNYIILLTSTATGLGMIFAVLLLIT